ncbi:hypothetical protein Ancab_004647 [Ancistrocladus abbreviatus]
MALSLLSAQMRNDEGNYWKQLMQLRGDFFVGFDVMGDSFDVVQGKFSTAAAYQQRMGPKEVLFWALIVRHSVSLRRHVFTAWLAVNGRLLAANCLVRCMQNIEVNCVLCSQVPESHGHLFFGACTPQRYAVQFLAGWGM